MACCNIIKPSGVRAGDPISVTSESNFPQRHACPPTLYSTSDGTDGTVPSRGSAAAAHSLKEFEESIGGSGGNPCFSMAAPNVIGTVLFTSSP